MGQEGVVVEVLYEDNHLLVIMKPAGLLSQADETGDADLLTLGRDYLKKRYNKPGNVFLGLVHRLDRPASGVMVLARTSKAAARLTDQFKTRQTDKRYLAVVEGHLAGAGAYEDYLLKEDRKPRVVSANHPKGKRAKLAWEALGHQDGATLVSIKLFTGRAHQIRLQFASRNHALLGDLRYGATREFDGQNLALHAYMLAFQHPTRKTAVMFTAMPPPSWQGWFPSTIKNLLVETQKASGPIDR